MDAAAHNSRISHETFQAMYRRLKAECRHDPADRRGALDALTAERLVTAAREVRAGRTVSLAAPVEGTLGADNPEPCDHQMTAVAPPQGTGGLHFATDRVSMNIHGNAHTHLDALCHVMYDGELYNGVPAATVTRGGAMELTVEVVADGIVGRGVLLDVPRARGVDWLEPGDHVTGADLLEAERAQGVTLGPGDLLLVRVGHRRRRNELGAWDAARARAGLHPDVMPLLAERRVAVLGSDGNNDTAPSGVTGIDYPIHVLAVNAMGMHMLDYLQLEDLAAACAEVGRWSFLCVVAPLRLPDATGSPVNPIAVL